MLGFSALGELALGELDPLSKSIAGQTLVYNYSVTIGSLTGAVQIDGVTIEYDDSIIPGVVSAAVQIAGQTLEYDDSVVPGGVTGAVSIDGLTLTYSYSITVGHIVSQEEPFPVVPVADFGFGSESSQRIKKPEISITIEGQTLTYIYDFVPGSVVAETSIGLDQDLVLGYLLEPGQVIADSFVTGTVVDATMSFVPGGLKIEIDTVKRDNDFILMAA